MSTDTAVDTETETETETVTKTAGACAIGAGAAAITCKAMVLGFVASGLALVGLSGIGPIPLMLGILALGSIFVYKGFSWAGRRPVILGEAGLLVMWLGFIAAGAFVTAAPGGSRELFGTIYFGMMPAGDILANPMGLIPVAILYISGTALFFAAIYDSYIRELDLKNSKGGMAAGLAGASICGGCGITGLAGAGMVLMTGSSATNATKFVGADLVMLIGLVGILGYTVYARALKQTVLALVGGVITFMLSGSIFGFPAEGGFLGMVGVTIPDTAVGDVIGTMITWIGLGIMFFALVWAYYPEMEVVPPEWKDRIRSTEPA